MSNPQERSGSGLPRRASPRRVILASHAILTGYGHWFPNDLRGSGSEEVRNPDIARLGPIHHGRRPIQPSRYELREFFRDGNRLLKHEPIWFRDQHRVMIARAFEECVKSHGYTIFAFAVLKNHLHFVIRRHRDRDLLICDHVANQIKQALWEAKLAPRDHPVWSDRPYTIFLHTPQDVRSRIRYVENNPGKEGLRAQHYDFVVPYR